jgi:malonate transporter and related proteins
MRTSLLPGENGGNDRDFLLPAGQRSSLGRANQSFLNAGLPVGTASALVSSPWYVSPCAERARLRRGILLFAHDLLGKPLHTFPDHARGRNEMKVADLVLPVFAIIVTGWLAEWLGYISRSLADGLVHFAYNVAMPALLFVTIAQEPARSLLEWRFLFAFGGGSILCFALVFLAARLGLGRDVASSTMHGMTASMTNTGFVALPILHSIYGQPAVLPAAVATVFVAAVMFPAAVILLESAGRSEPGKAGSPLGLAKQIVLNPMVLSTLIGLAWTIMGLPMPAPLAAYMNIFAAALTPCALFAIGLGLSLEGIASNITMSIVLAVVKLVIMPLIVYGLCVASGLNPLYTIAAVICAAVPTAKTAYILAGAYKVEESLVAATVSITTLLSVATLLGWLYALSGLGVQVR